MSLEISLVSGGDVEIENWKRRKQRAIEQAKEGLNLIVPLVEQYYDDRRPLENKCLYNGSITHNLSRMAKEVGLYEVLWKPEEIGAATGKDIIYLLDEGLKLLKDDPGHYRMFNAENGWGSYEDLVGFVEGYLNACIEYPDGIIKVSR